MKCLLPGPAHPSSTAAFIDPKRESPAEVAQVQTLHHSDQQTLRCAPSQSQPLSRNRSPEHSSIVPSAPYGLPHRLSIIQIVQFSLPHGADIPTDCNGDAANPGIAFFARLVVAPHWDNGRSTTSDDWGGRTGTATPAGPRWANDVRSHNPSTPKEQVGNNFPVSRLKAP